MEHFLMPVLALVIWSLIIWCVMYSRRIPAMSAAKMNPQDAAHPGSLDFLPSRTRAAADNYNHLMEQPTIFYALMFCVYLMEIVTPMTLYLAWTYVGLRVLHSLVQVTVNRVMVRFVVFFTSTLVLIVMALSSLSVVL